MAWRGSRLAIFIFFTLATFAIKTDGQELNKQSVDSLWWEQKVEQLDYTEELKERKNMDGDMPDLSWVNSPILKYSVLALIIIGLLVLLYYLFRNDFFSMNEDEDEKEYHLLIEEDLDDRFYEMDLDLLLKEAESNADWKFAVRIRFLMILKSLIDEGRIDWHKDLTNLQILYQIKEQSERKSFSEIVFEFERVWYGNQAGSSEIYTMFDQISNAFIQELKKDVKG